MKAGTVISLFPGEWHSYHPDDETGWDEYWVGFKGAYIDDRVANPLFSARAAVAKYRDKFGDRESL